MTKLKFEVWKDIKGYESLYQISNFGRVKNLKSNYILKICLDRQGYSRISLWKNNKGKHFSVHRLVAKAFISNPYNKPEVNHKDGIKIHCYADNLEWATRSENEKHAYSISLKSNKGEAHSQVKLTQADVFQIRDSSLSQKILAEIFKVTQSHISHIKLNRCWVCND